MNSGNKCSVVIVFRNLTAREVAFNVALAAIVAGVFFLLVRTHRMNTEPGKPVAGLRQTDSAVRIQESPVDEHLGTGSESFVVPRMTMPVIRPAQLSPYERLVEQSHSAAIAIQNALQLVTSKAMHDRNIDFYGCNPDHQLIGEFAIEFESEVFVTADTIRAERWRFIKVRNGTPLQPDVVKCLEDALGGPYTVLAEPEGEPFAEYTGPLPIVYRVNFRVPPVTPE